MANLRDSVIGPVIRAEGLTKVYHPGTEAEVVELDIATGPGELDGFQFGGERLFDIDGH